MILFLSILSLMFSVEQQLVEELTFEMPPNDISIVEVVDYFD
ncbi:hypothetical protein [Carboxylicivirga sp. RSCT41]